MPIAQQQCNRIFNYVLKFANKNQDLRIEMGNRLYPSAVRFNLKTTGATVAWPHIEPTLAELQQLVVDANTGLPFKNIHFRTSDGGPGLANLEFKEGRFTVDFVERFDQRVIDFCEQLNQIIGKPQSLSQLQKEEREYQEALSKLHTALADVPTSKQEITIDVRKKVEQIGKLKREGQTLTSELTKSLNDMHSLTQKRINAKDVDETQLNQILSYVAQFASNNSELRIKLGNGGPQFNLASTGATIAGFHKEPTLAELQQLVVDTKTGLPFEEISFRRGDSGPGLANIKFEKGRFTVQFVDGYDPKVIDFCEQLNQIIGKPQSLSVMRREEQEYLDALKRLQKAVANIPSSRQGVIAEIGKEIEQVEALKERGSEPVNTLTQSLVNMYASIQNRLSAQETASTTIVNQTQRNQICNYVIDFAKKNSNLRVELEDEARHDVARFNLVSTGATVVWPHKEPTLAELQQLVVDANTGLPFKKIHFRTSDGGPGLANLKFKEGRFTVDFVEGFDQRVIDFCDNLNNIMRQPQNIKSISQDEKEYQEALIKLKSGLAGITSEKRVVFQEIILETQKILKQVEQLKKEGATPTPELTESLINTHAVLQGKMTPEDYQTYAAEVEESSSIGMKILGGIMSALGALVAAVGIVLAATGVGLAAGIATAVAGVGLVAAGVGLFSVKKNTPPEADEMDNSNIPTPIK
ncbi:hypothetical protein [Legionella fallonii]|uniref:Uncharacterized protein n=1 Tax=Legionella fallonii LLAP-10 TaxID=1212491 RepID=A0A098GB14_9GAMM|nr:hypothetical protein [Legionella fallonii]CEG58655.1 protein of unknown function [Legionella fallonii LLAP-10]